MTRRSSGERASDRPGAHQLWGGRFQFGLEAAAEQLNRSLPVDHRLWPQDLEGAGAWATALRAAGILTEQELATILSGLERVGERLSDGAAVGAPDEDVHTLVERLLYEEVGPVAGKLNTGRSRNDQVATDLRLWCLSAITSVDAEVAALGSTLVARAEGGLDLILPGYTHGQPAQPVRWAFVLAAHAWPLARDRARLARVAEQTSELPLGSGAIAGSGVAVDQESLRRALGFQRIAPNALDVTGDRDCVLDLLHALAMVATHLARLGAELYTYASAEYGFLHLADGSSTGSSLLPQKRNPDIFELARAKAARVAADLSGMLALVKSLPAGYSKDLQEDKAFLFDAVDQVLLTLPAVRGAVATMTPVPKRMAAALHGNLLATDLADGLAAAGVPFREAHSIVGRLVREAEMLGVDVTAVPPAAADALHPGLGVLVAELGSWEDSVERRRGPSGSSRAAVMGQLGELRERFGAAGP